jgi:ribosome biogenesis GTPase
MDILAVLPRKTKFSRRAAGEHGHEQVVAANADALFIIVALDRKPNLRKIERYLAVAHQSGAEPVILLNKADLHPDPDSAVVAVRAIAGKAAIVALSAKTGKGCSLLKPWLKSGKTVALLGPSGVGKSALVNRLMRDEVQIVQEVRDQDAKGRHTTTRRELFVVPSGALMIDTPGLRELQLWASNIGDTFDDIAVIALKCRFSNCRHHTEPGCAIRAALESGELPHERWDSYHKLRAEQAEMKRHLAARPDRQEKIVWKKISENLRARYRFDARQD